MGKTGRNCTVCAHPKRHLIDLGIVLGVGSVTLAQRFGLSKHSILRHSRAHLTAAQRAALASAAHPSEIDLAALRTSESEGLLGSLVAQRARLLSIVEMCLEGRNAHGAVSAENAIGSNLSTTAKILGQLVTHHEVRHTSVLLQPDYLRLRGALLAALRPHPAALRDVSAALHALETDAAKDITAAAGKTEPLTIEATALPPPPPAPLGPPPC